MIVDQSALLYACGLLGLAVLLLVIEFLVVSFGLLALAALASAIGAIWFAFAAGDAVGWAFVVLVPVLAVVLVRQGLRRLQASSVVPRSAVTGDAGYHHVAERIGVAVGARGVMVTDAYPTGRARFADGECDVQVLGGSLERAALVVVKRIDGPVVFVAGVAAGAESSAPDRA